VHKKLISTVKEVAFVSDRISCIILRGHWCHIIVLNVHAPTEDKTDEVKDSFYEELQQVFDKLPKYHMKMLLNRQLGMKVYTKLVMIMELDFATSKSLAVRSMMSPHCSILKYTWTSPDGKIHNWIDHILVDR
jgi:hypothetical protein